MPRYIDAELLTTNIAQIAKACAKSDKQKALVGRILFMIEDMPTIEAEPVTWYTAEENQPDSIGDDVLIVDHDGKYHVAYYCSKGNWIDTNTGNPIEVAKWRYLGGDKE